MRSDVVFSTRAGRLPLDAGSSGAVAKFAGVPSSDLTFALAVIGAATGGISAITTVVTAMRDRPRVSTDVADAPMYGRESDSEGRVVRQDYAGPFESSEVPTPFDPARDSMRFRPMNR